MSNFKRRNKLDMEQILVAYCPVGTSDQAFAKGTALVDGTTSLGIADGQLGVLSWDHNPRNGGSSHGNFIAAGETPDQVRAIKILQGTPVSSNITLADPWEVGDKGYVESGIIRRDNIRSVTVQKCMPKVMANNAVVDLPDPCDNTEYRLFANMTSSRILTEWGYSGLQVDASFETPCYTAIGTTDPKDHYLQNILFDYNTQSRLFANAYGNQRAGNYDTVALAINIAGGSGVAIGTIDCGDSIPFQVDTAVDKDTGCSTSNTSSFVADIPFVLSLAYLVQQQAAAAACGAVATPITGASTIEPIDLSTAGDAANVDAFIIIGLEHQTYRGIDEDPNVMPNVNVNLQKGFNVTPAPALTRTSPFEGKGHGRNWLIENDKRVQRTIHNMYSDRDRGSLTDSEGVKYIDPNSRYTSLIIDYYDTEENGISGSTDSPKQVTILTCCDYVCDTVANIAAKITANAAQSDISLWVDLLTTTEVACCPGGASTATATNLQADLAAVLLNWLIDADADFNNGIAFDDFNYQGGPSALFVAAGV